MMVRKAQDGAQIRLAYAFESSPLLLNHRPPTFPWYRFSLLRLSQPEFVADTFRA